MPCLSVGSLAPKVCREPSEPFAGEIVYEGITPESMCPYGAQGCGHVQLAKVALQR